MSRIQNVPTARIGEIVQSFANEGKKKITVEKQDDGKWTINAS